MMKKYSLLKMSLLFAGLVTLGACDNKDDNRIFDKDPVHRIKETEDLIKKELISSENGWIMTFFPSNTQLGGYTFWFDFKEDGRVLTRSDFNRNDLSVQNERYNFVLLSTVALNFPTGSTIHQFPEMSNSNVLYKTDIEFLFQQIQGNDILFKGHTTRSDIKMTKATAEEKQFDLTKNHQLLDRAVTLRNVVVYDGGELSSYNFRMNAKTRYASVLSADKTSSVNSKGGIGVGFTADKMIVSPAIEFEDGTSVSELVFDGNEFVGQSGSNTVTIY